MSNSSETKDDTEECDFTVDNLRFGEKSLTSTGGRERMLRTLGLTTWECSRPVWDRAQKKRCVWHADVENKPPERLKETIGEGDLHGVILSPNSHILEITFPEDTGLINADLSGGVIRDADLADALLPNADLSGALLSNFVFSGASLSGANLSHATLSGTDFTDAILADADLQNASLRKSDFQDADLQNTDLRNANLQDADFRDADLQDADLRDADLRDADLQDADLRDADLQDAEFRNANLQDADLRNANLSNGDMNEAILQRVDAEEADFTSVDLTEASLAGADCESADFEKAVLIRASLENADLVDANLAGVHWFGARLGGARIDSATKLVAEGSVGEVTVDERCRYDVDTPPEDPESSLAMDQEDLEAAPDTPRVIQLRRGRSAYRQLEELARQNGFPTLQSRMFKRRQEMRRHLLHEQGERTRWLFAELQRWLFVYGESFHRVLSVSAIAVSLFWLLFTTTGSVEKTDGTVVTVGAIADNPRLTWETLYHSLSVFFAGTGPLAPIGILGQVLTVSLRATGPILLALLIFVLGRRAAR